MKEIKKSFLNTLQKFAKTLKKEISTSNEDWNIKGFIDIHKNVYTISSDSKIISKILEIQLFPKIQQFADENDYELILAEKQNWYPDISLVYKKDSTIKFAIDIKTTYRLENYDGFCNGFTLGSHREYFRNRTSTKNIQLPYGDYQAHFCLGIIYTRTSLQEIDEKRMFTVDDLVSINSVIKEVSFFVEEKWKIASDRGGSGNTANIGSINYIEDIIHGNGVFANLGEAMFDEYWINQGVLQVPNPKKKGAFKALTKLSEYLEFKNLDVKLVNTPKPKLKNKK